MAWLNLTMPNQTVKNGLKAKKIKLPKMKTTNKIFMYLLAPFILQNFKKITRADQELSGSAIFGPKMAHLPWKFFFWYKQLLLPIGHYQLLSTYWLFSLWNILKKFFKRIQNYKDAQFLGQKWSISLNSVGLYWANCLDYAVFSTSRNW